MAATPVTGSAAAPPTGNALTDALAVDPAQAAAAVNAANQSAANVASDCLWPPSGQFSVPIIPGLYTQSFQIPCLVTYSEARALVAVGLMLAGGLVIMTGVSLMAAVAVAPEVAGVLGYRALLGRAGPPPAPRQEKPAKTPTQADVAPAA